MAEPAFIALGSNLSAETNLPLAAGRLAELGRLRAVSMVYQNPAIGASPAPDFLNAAVLINTNLESVQIREQLRRIETVMGRVRTLDRYAPRVIDLDLCMLGSQIVDASDLKLPDPDLLTRPFLAVTMAELAPDFLHPVTGEPLADIAHRLRPGADLRARPDIAGRLAALVSRIP